MNELKNECIEAIEALCDRVMDTIYCECCPFYDEEIDEECKARKLVRKLKELKEVTSNE